jgi:16S rRNA (cytosine967-C5)-methyltransferase
MLKPGGALLYVTCSVLRAENEQVIGEFLASQTDAIEQTMTETLPALMSGPLKHGVQLLPGTAATDGFYYALMKRESA